MRTSNTQLPSAHELFEILNAESQRKAVRYDFLAQNPRLFDAYKRAVAHIGADAEWIESYPDLELETLGLAAIATLEQVYDAILRRKIKDELLNTLFDSLVVNDAVQECEAIFVFGSPANARIMHAIELYNSGVAPLLIVSGNGPHYGTNELSEAERMSQYAIDSGVPQTSIMIEPESITLPDNVKRSLDMFELQEFRPKRMCVVATTYISQRARMEWYKFTPWNIEIVSSPAQAQTPELRRDTWHQSERGIRMLLNEYTKIIVEHKMDLIRRDND